MKRVVKTECACEKCQNACRSVPGWFRPGEAEKAARLLKMPLSKFFKKYCGVNWWNFTRDETFVIAPATIRMKPGSEYPGDPRGQCVFLTSEGRCRIHAAKPYHCAMGNPHEMSEHGDWIEKSNRRTATLWRKHQRQIVMLLGRKPESAYFSPFESLLGSIFGGF